ncbi:MAG: hypothetical protein Q7J07_04045 [Pelolinea sp.]|nr:hypothetical protein [Pelolinea sp.]
MNKALFGIAILPLICLGVILLTGLVIIFALRRGTRSINEKVKEYSAPAEPSIGVNNRWGHGDLKAPTQSKTKEIEMEVCPACGGENPSGSSACAFCGRAQ